MPSSLDEKLAARGFPAAERSPRFQQSLDVMRRPKADLPAGADRLFTIRSYRTSSSSTTDFDWVASARSRD